MHAQRHHRGAHRPSHLKAVKSTDPPHPGSRPEPEKKIGYSSDAFQSFVAGHLIALEERVADVIPASAKEEIRLDSDMPDFSVPGTSISAKTILQYVREALPLPVSTISGNVTGTPDHYVLHLVLVERGQVYRFATPEGAIADLDHNLSNLALDVLKKHSPYIYASYESAEAQARCYAGKGACDFSEAERIFSGIVDAGDEQPNYKWALLGLSKIDEAHHDYKGEINAVSRLSAEYPSAFITGASHSASSVAAWPYKPKRPVSPTRIAMPLSKPLQRRPLRHLIAAASRSTTGSRRKMACPASRRLHRETRCPHINLHTRIKPDRECVTRLAFRYPRRQLDSRQMRR